MNKKQLAKLGRGGDTKIRNIDGKPAHVNTSEAKLIDRKGRLGEILVKARGSGTTNPQTGLSEYFDPLTIMAVSGIVKAGAGLFNAFQKGKIDQATYDAQKAQIEKEEKFLQDKYNMDLAAYEDAKRFANDKFIAEKEAYGDEGKYLDELYEAQKTAFDDQGRFLSEQYAANTAAYNDEGRFIQESYESEADRADALREAYKSQYATTRTEQSILDRLSKQAEEGDPFVQKLYQDELNRATGAIRQEGQQGRSRAVGQAYSQGLGGSIVAQELARQVDRDTLKKLSETAREMASNNQREQAGFMREAQSSMDTMNLGIDARRRAALMGIAGIADPVKAAQGAAPVKGTQGAAPVKGYQGAAPVLDTVGPAPVKGITGADPVNQKNVWGDVANVVAEGFSDYADYRTAAAAKKNKKGSRKLRGGFPTPAKSRRSNPFGPSPVHTASGSEYE